MSENLVRKYRQQAGISGEVLARRAEMSSGDLSKLERGIRHAYPAWRKRIAAALNQPEEVLFPSEAAGHVAG